MPFHGSFNPFGGVGVNHSAIRGGPPPVSVGNIADLSVDIVGSNVTFTYTPATNANSHQGRVGTTNPPAGTPFTLTGAPVSVGDQPETTEIFCQVRGVKDGSTFGSWSNVDSVISPTIHGPTIVTNGTFTSNVTGWTASTSTVTWDAGKLRVTGAAGGAGAGRADQTISGLTVGATYRFQMDSPAGTSPSPSWRVRQDSTAGTNLISGSGFSAVDQTFVAPASGTVAISLIEGNSSTSDFSTFDNIVLRKIL